MPLYEYQCTCNPTSQPVEMLVSIAEADKQICPDCQQILTRLISNTKGIVKGSKNPVKQ